jgi:Putative auto-transporter adhesin, head GIN domain
MKSGLLMSALIVAMALTAGFTKEQSVEKETRNLTGFKKVNFGVAGNLYVNLGSDYKVVLEGDKSFLEEVETEVSGSTLVIKNENWHWHGNQKVNVYITMPELKGLGVSGSGKAEIKDALKTDNLDFSVSGSGTILTADLAIGKLDVGISGSGDVIVGGSGQADDADVSISGSGSYSGESLKIARGDFRISGSGNCTCNVTEKLDASVSGSGNITYTGDPKIDARVSGSGKVRSK